jgi:alkyldihydroxyacetonephosphate synthase
MVQRLEPMVIRLYDPNSTRKVVKRVLGLDLEGAYMVLGFDGWPEIAAAQQKRALDVCLSLGGRDLGREPGEEWWHHRYDFYYPPLSLHLPQMYGTTETVTTFDRIEKLYYAKRNLIEQKYADWEVDYIGHFSTGSLGRCCTTVLSSTNRLSDPYEASTLHNEMWTRRAHFAGSRRDAQRAPRHRSETGAPDAGTVWPGLAAVASPERHARSAGDYESRQIGFPRP